MCLELGAKYAAHICNPTTTKPAEQFGTRRNMLCIRIPVAFSFQVNTLGLETAAGNLSGIREGKEKEQLELV